MHIFTICQLDFFIKLTKYSYIQNSMQQSDQLLLSSLGDFIKFPTHVTSLDKIKADEIFQIAMNVLQAIGIDVKDVKQIEKQKFRSTTKLNQKITKQLAIDLELNDLLNPNSSFVRKALLLFLAKLGSGENINQNLNPNNGGQDNSEKRKRKKALTNWLQDQWIHPALVQQVPPTYNASIYPLIINKKSFKSNLLPSLISPLTKSNILPILVTSLNKNKMRQKQSQLNAGITKKKGDQNATVQTNKLIASNFQDWNMAEQRLLKIKRKIEKDKQALQQTKKIEEQQAKKDIQKAKEGETQLINENSVFQAQLQEKLQEKQNEKQTKQKQHPEKQSLGSPTKSSSISTLSSQNPLQILKEQAQKKRLHFQSTIQLLLSQLSKRREQSRQSQQQKQNLQSQIQHDQDRLLQYKSKTDQLKKIVQKKQLVLTAVQSPKQIQNQIKQFQKDIKQMQEQVKIQVLSTTKGIQTMKIQSQQKLEALKDIKMKLNRIQIQYKQICEEIQDKLQRKGKIKITKSGITRTYYSKKISEIDKRWRETQKQVNKIKRDLEIMKEKTNIITDMSGILENEIISLIQMDKSSKTEQENKALKQVFGKCQSCFKTTLKTLAQINNVKEETRQYEVKVHTLTSQNYKQGIQKVNAALVQLKKELQQIGKRK